MLPEICPFPFGVFKVMVQGPLTFPSTFLDDDWVNIKNRLLLRHTWLDSLWRGNLGIYLRPIRHRETLTERSSLRLRSNTQYIQYNRNYLWVTWDVTYTYYHIDNLLFKGVIRPFFFEIISRLWYFKAISACHRFNDDVSNKKVRTAEVFHRCHIVLLGLCDSLVYIINP